MTHHKKRVLRALGLRDPNLHARKSEFRWGAHLGSGTYGEVTQCTWLTKNPPLEVAIKVVSKSMIHDCPRQISLLNRCLKLNHPHVVALLDWFQSKEHIYMVFELAEGGELFDHAISQGPFSDRDACVMVRDICEAVRYIHAQGIVHRDLKPENLFVRGPGPYAAPYELVVADFGVAVHVTRPDGTEQTLSGICGSPGYTAPEVYRRQRYGKPVDIWAIGVLAFILLSGRFPFAHLSGPEFLADLNQAPIRFPKKFAISPDAENFILGCLKPDPEKRWTAAEALEHPWFAKLNAEDPSERHTTTSVADTDYTRCELTHSHPALGTTEDKHLERLDQDTRRSDDDSGDSDSPELVRVQTDGGPLVVDIVA